MKKINKKKRSIDTVQAYAACLCPHSVCNCVCDCVRMGVDRYVGVVSPRNVLTTQLLSASMR